MRLLLLCIGCLLCASCTSYKLGTPETPFKKLYVEPAQNSAFVPQAQALLTSQVMQALLRDGQLELCGPEEADTTLSIRITEYKRDIASTQLDNTALARSYDLTLEAELTLTDNHTGKAYFQNRSVNTTVNALTDESFQTTEYQSLSTLTRRLAEEIRRVILHAW